MPPLPPSLTVPPPLPSPPLTPSVVDAINARFRSADPSRALLLHQWDASDGTDPDGGWWRPPSAAETAAAAAAPANSYAHARGLDRISASVLSARIGADPNGKLPLYSYELGGLIFDAEMGLRAMRCAYETDAGNLSDFMSCDEGGDEGDDDSDRGFTDDDDASDDGEDIV